MTTGRKTGGRQKGTPNRPRDARAAAAAGGLDPTPVPPIKKDAAPEPAPDTADPAREFPRYRTARTATLVPYANNARTHTAAQIDKIAASIREFGFTNPVLTDGRRGIVAGHGRVLAAEKLGMDRVPVIELSHLTAAQRRAYVIADNRLALDAGWDEAILASELADLRLEGFDLSLTGFGDGELASLLGDVPEMPTERGVHTTVETIECPNCHHVFAA